MLPRWHRWKTVWVVDIWEYAIYVCGSFPQSLYLFVCWKCLVVNESTVARKTAVPNSTVSCSHLGLTGFIADVSAVRSEAVLTFVYKLFRRKLSGSSCVHFRNLHVKILKLNFKINISTWTDLEPFQSWRGTRWLLLREINSALPIITLKPLILLRPIYSQSA